MRKTTISFVLGWVSLLCAGGAATANTPWAEERADFRKEIVVSADGAPTGGPILLRLTPQNFAFADADPLGADVRVVDASGSPRPYYIESFDAKTGMAAIWFNAQTIKEGAQERYHLYYGAKEAKAADASSAVFGPAELLTLDFTGTGAARDRSGKGNHALTAAPTGPGFAGDAARFSGAEAVLVRRSASLDLAADAPFVFQAWVRTEGSEGAIAERLATNQPIMALSIEGLRLTADVPGARIVASKELPADAWAHVALARRRGGLFELMINGEIVGSAQGAPAAIVGDLRLGNGFVGQIDMVRMTASEASGAEIALQSQMQIGRSGLAYGVDEQRGGHFDVRYLTTVINNVTLEGWVVIALCFVLLLLAARVVVDKVLTLGSSEGRNRAFVKAYQSISFGEPVPDSVEPSALGQLYVLIIRELERRGGRISAAAVAAVRARLDTVLAEQSAALNRGMVTLTMAISGGPFLGLLGTVLGVMITFAAIATEGNVDVNSIAPGVAAALLATAAGLVVAIPALFAYNFLLTRIKLNNATARAFADELVARMVDERGA